jgi:hypothetical protein
MMLPNLSRRQWLQTVATGAGAAFAVAPHTFVIADAPSKPRPKIAAVFTELRFRSHAYNILENFFAPYLFNGKLVDPGVDVVAMVADQFPKDDMAKDAAKRLGVPLVSTLEAALCRGGDKLAVDGVLVIGEHGDYPYNELGQHLYPRKEWFDRSVAVMKAAGRFVPYFNDKHFSYRTDWAKEMVATARRHGFPMLGGSSVPLASRRPTLELEPECEIEEALAVHGGAFEVYDFHALEVLQSMVDVRKGAETGVVRIEFLDGDAARKAADQRRWSRDLFEAAMAAERAAGPRQPRPNAGRRPEQINDASDDPAQLKHAIVVTYRDGLKATVLSVGQNSSRWNFACRLKGEPKPQATAFFNSPWGNRGLFKALSHAAQRLFIDGREPFPAERTLLTTCMTDAAMHARAARRAIDTPELAIAYKPRPWREFRELGDTWKIITTEVPQPTTFDPGDAKFMKP